MFDNDGELSGCVSGIPGMVESGLPEAWGSRVGLGDLLRRGTKE